jgi:hypothetical protein
MAEGKKYFNRLLKWGFTVKCLEGNRSQIKEK